MRKVGVMVRLPDEFPQSPSRPSVTHNVPHIQQLI